MSPVRILALSLLVLLSGCSGCEREEAPKPPPVVEVDAGSVVPIGRLEGLSGDVRLERGGKVGPAVEGPLLAGDAVETGESGSATVRFPGDRTVEVGSEGRFAVGSDATGIVMKVERGIVLSRVPAGGKADSAGSKVTLNILTPFGLTRVGPEQSEVKVAVAEDSARVEVKLGAIELVSKDGKTLRAAQGDAVDLTRERAQVTSAPRVVELAPIPVTVRASSGVAEVKSKDTGRWRKVRREGEVLAFGDGVRTKGGEAVLSLKDSGTVLTLAPGAEAVLESAGQQGTIDEARVNLLQGLLAVQLAMGRESRVVLPEMTVESGSGARLEIRRTHAGMQVAAHTGDVTLRRGEARQELRAGERATVGTDGNAKVEPLEEAVVAVGPGDGTEVFHRGLSEVALTWEGEGDAVVEAAQDAAFKRPVLWGRVHRASVNVTALAKGTLYWRARKEDGTQVAAGSVHFAPESPTNSLARARNVVPEGPEKTTIFYQDKPPAVTFTYGEEPQARTYRVAVYKAGSLATPVVQRTVSETRAALEAGQLGEGSYLWSVTPLSQAGAALKGGRMNKLELVYDNSVVGLVVDSPRQGVPAAEKVRASGVAPVNARLSINGRAVPLDAKHRFDTWVAPMGMPPLLVFKMTRPGAPDVLTVRTLKPRGP
ncbi:FecR family protein [Corallococcus sp. M7]